MAPYFLGPAADNDHLLEELVVEFLRDHVYWRRNFHPEDGQRIPPGAARKDAFADFHARTRTELYALSAELKRAVPFFHPRYVGHVASDLLLPGVVARQRGRPDPRRAWASTPPPSCSCLSIPGTSPTTSSCSGTR